MSAVAGVVARGPVSGRYLTFHLGQSRYAVPIRDVREVVRLPAITAVPQMPAHVRGVMNLRGAVVAVLDLRAKFQMGAIEYADRACVIVFDAGRGEGAGACVATIVDGVDDVLPLSAAQLAAAPDFAGAVQADYLLGVATTPEGVWVVLNMPNILATEGSLVLPALTTDVSTAFEPI
ncbi:MAG: chemotaxis protein CheW [Pseudomonadota bacterium]